MKKQSIWHNGRITLLVVLLTGTLLSYLGYVAAMNLENRTLQLEQERLTQLVRDVVNTELRFSLSLLASTRGLFLSSPDVSREAFSHFAKSELEGHTSIQALEWIPLVADSQREVYRQLAVQDGLVDFDIRERSPQGDLIPATVRPEYFPIYYVEPLQGNEAALGFDLASNEQRRTSLEQARLTRQARSTASITLVQETAHQKGFLVFQPVFKYADGDFQQEEASFIGYTLGVFRIADLFDIAVKPIKEQLGSLVFELTDTTDPTNPDLLLYREYSEQPEILKDSSWQKIQTIDFTGRSWTLTTKATPEFITNHRSLIPWIVLTTGIIFALMVTGYLQTLLQREIQVRELVTQRTAELHSSEKLNRTIVENAVDAVITIDIEGTIGLFNPAAVKMFGYSEQEVIGQNVKMLMPDPYHSEHDGYLTRYQQTGAKHIIGIGREVSGQHKDGTIFPINLSVGEAIENDITFYVGTITNLTELKTKEQALREFKDRLDLATRAGGIGVWDYDVINGMLEWDDRMFEIYGISREQFPGAYQAWCKALHPEDREHAEGEMNRAIEGQKDFNTEFRIVWPDQSVHAIKAAGLVLCDSKEQAVRMIGVNWDISKQKEIDNLKNEFISTVSHELRTPLTSIQGSLELILSGAMGELPEECTPLLEIASSNSMRLVRLINDILDIEKIESGMMEFLVKPVDVMAIVQHSIAAIQAYADEYGVKFNITSQLMNCYVMADSDRLVQVLTNLLSNATKFSPEGGAVEVGVMMSNNSVRFSVTDYGSGIPDQFRERIFAKFSQADASSTKKQGGTGLGLSICKAIIEKLGGQIDFDSEFNKKTCFYFDLPVYKQQTVSISSQRTGKTAGGILICEHDQDTARLLKLMLEKKGFPVDIALTAEQAKQQLSSQHYAAMIVDLMLLGESGNNFFKELRQTEGVADIPVIVISPVTDKDKAELNGEVLSVCDWLDKPIDPSRLDLAIRRAIDGKAKDYFRILHIEDDPDIVSLIKTLLKSRATVDVAGDLKTAEKKLQQNYDLVILDLTLPDGSGSNLLLEIARRDPPIPVVVFSAQDKIEEVDASVSAHFVKSKTRNEDLVKTIESILKQKTNPNQD